MTLDELQKKITPLPWKVEGNFIPHGKGHCDGGEGGSIISGQPHCGDVVIGGCQDEQGGIVGIPSKNDAAYLAHCANHFQQVVEALARAQCDCSPKERLSGHKIDCWMPDAIEVLKSAQEVEP